MQMSSGRRRRAAAVRIATFPEPDQINSHNLKQGISMLCLIDRLACTQCFITEQSKDNLYIRI